MKVGGRRKVTDHHDEHYVLLRWFGTDAEQGPDRLERECLHDILAAFDTISVKDGPKLDWDHLTLKGPVRRRVKVLCRTIGSICHWGHLLRHNPQHDGDCLFDAIAAGAGLQLAQGAARSLCIQAWQDEKYVGLLAKFAKQDGISPMHYVGLLEQGRWGGLPEAAVLADLWGLTIEARTAEGALLYGIGQGSRCVALGLARNHYVLLCKIPVHWRLSTTMQSIKERFYGLSKRHAVPGQEWHSQVERHAGAGARGDGRGRSSTPSRQLGARRSRSPHTPRQPVKTALDYKKLQALKPIDGADFFDEVTWFELAPWGEAGHGGWKPYCNLCNGWVDRIHRLSKKHLKRLEDQGPRYHDGPLLEAAREEQELLFETAKREMQGRSSNPIVLLPHPKHRGDREQHRPHDDARPDVGAASSHGRSFSHVARVDQVEVSVRAVAKQEPDAPRRERRCSPRDDQHNDARHAQVCSVVPSDEASWFSWRKAPNGMKRLHCDICGVWASRRHRSSSRHNRRVTREGYRQPATRKELDEEFASSDDLSEGGQHRAGCSAEGPASSMTN